MEFELDGMKYNLESMMGLDQLELYYEVNMAGIDGENFYYSVYFIDNPTDEKFEETKKAIAEFLMIYDEKDVYLGYMDVSKENDKISIYLDLGNTKPEYQNTAINGILEALNNVQGIRSVIINESCDFEF